LYTIDETGMFSDASNVRFFMMNVDMSSTRGWKKLSKLMLLSEEGWDLETVQ
jgi:hypothetical protein